MTREEALLKGREEGYNKALRDLTKLMYIKSFEETSELQKWDGGCWIRYKLFENCVDELKAQGRKNWERIEREGEE